MTKPLLRPQDVAPEHAQEVLDFLNAVETPEDIAQAVEILDELDIGIRIAQRILDRRQELGSFASLQQLAEVPLIGPERFTEIVITLSGASLPPDMSGLSQTTVAGLLEEMNRMRDQLQTFQTLLGAREQLSLRALQSQPFLGQPINLVATALDLEGSRPRIDIPITLTTTWGILRSIEGQTVREGVSLTTRTGADGDAQVLLIPPTSEQLTDIQQSTLELALANLDSHAITPRDIEEELRDLVTQYRLESNVQLREAMDIYYREFGHPLFDNINVRDFLHSWPMIEATVLAYVADDTDEGLGKTSVRSMAFHPVLFKNWLGAWTQTFSTQSESTSTLGNDLNELGQRGGEFGGLLNGFHTKINNFLTRQHGLVGEYIGKRVVQNSLHTFLNTHIQQLPIETQSDLFPVLDVTSRTLVTAGTSVLASLGQARENLRKEFTSSVSNVETKLGAINTQFVEVNSQLRNVTSKVGAFDGHFTRIDTTLTTMTNHVGAFDGRFSQMDTKLTSMTNQVGTFDGRFTRMDTTLTSMNDQVSAVDGRFSQMDTKLTSINNQVGAVDGRFTDINTKLTTMNNQVGAVDGRFTDINTKLTTMKNQVGTVSGRFSDMDTKLETMGRQVTTGLDGKVAANDFTGFQTRVDGELANKLDAPTFNNFERNVDSRLDQTVSLTTFRDKQSETDNQFRTLQTGLDNQVAENTAIKIRQTNVETTLGQKASTKALNTFRGTVNTSLNSMVTISQLNSVRSSLTNSINRKASTSALSVLQRNLTTSLNAKASKNDLRTVETGLSNKILTMKNTPASRNPGTISRNPVIAPGSTVRR